MAVDGVVVTAIPGDHLPLLPVVGLIGNFQLSALKSRNAQVDVEDVVGRTAVGLHIGAWLHLDYHDLLVLVRRPREPRLRREPLPQQCTGLWKDTVTFRRELTLLVQQYSIPLAFFVEEAVGVLEAGLCLIGQRPRGLLLDHGEVIFQKAANGQILPGLSAPNRHAAEASNPNLRSVLEVVPGYSFAGSILPGLPFPGHLADLLEQLLSLIDATRVLELQC
mmetsp:Transcript_14068/g.33565  ORF Transcript_14068/g.33565 Transcript_14068/m.33565 type:complete len:221 (-) Transcript_14068:571-1233(-)